MNDKDKELLFIDLCGRLPYKVKVHCECASLILIGDIITLDIRAFDKFFNKETEYVPYDVLKPYLFPMYTMTEEQYKTYCELEHSGNMEHLSLPLLEWLNKNHFDYRGLIEKGLAIDATNKNIY